MGTTQLSKVERAARILGMVERAEALPAAASVSFQVIEDAAHPSVALLMDSPEDVEAWTTALDLVPDEPHEGARGALHTAAHGVVYDWFLSVFHVGQVTR